MKKRTYKRMKNRLYREIKARMIAEKKLSMSARPRWTARETRHIDTLKVSRGHTQRAGALSDGIMEYEKEAIARMFACKLLEEGYIAFHTESLEAGEYSEVRIDATLDVVKPIPGRGVVLMYDTEKLLAELDRIIEVGIVNAHHDRDVLKAIRKRLKDQQEYIKELQDKL